jgi:hypothetical protein
LPLLLSKGNHDAISTIAKTDSWCAVSGIAAIGVSEEFPPSPIAPTLHSREHCGELTNLRITIQWIGHALPTQLQQHLNLAVGCYEHGKSMIVSGKRRKRSTDRHPCTARGTDRFSFRQSMTARSHPE